MTITNRIVFLFLGVFSFPLFAIPPAFLALEKSRMERRIHQYASQLEKFYELCSSIELQSALNAGYCAIVRSDVAQSKPPSAQHSQMSIVDSLIKKLSTEKIAQEEKLFIEMRLFAYLPRPYGQNFARSLLALESLKRLKPDTPNLGFYEREIRFLQGKEPEETPSDPSEVKAFLDQYHYGWIVGLQFVPNGGFGGHLGYEDDKLNDGPWGIRSIASISTMPLLIGVGSISYREGATRLVSDLRYSYGKEAFYGTGPDTHAEDQLLWKLQRIELGFLYDTRLSPELTAGVGIKMKDQRVYEPSSFTNSNVGPHVRLNVSELDQEESPRYGYRVSMYGTFFNYQQFGLEAQGALPLGQTSHLNGGIFYEEEFGKVPEFLYLRLGENYKIPGISPYRFQDLTLLAAWAQVRQELSLGLGGGLFASSSCVGASIDDLFRHRTLFGGGAFVDWRWSRFPRNDMRVELSRFVDETYIQVGASYSL